MQVMRMGTTTDGKPLPAALRPLCLPTPHPHASGGDYSPSRARRPCSPPPFLGGFGKKKQDDPPPANQKPNTSATSAGCSMESQTTNIELLFRSIDPIATFEVPAGYKLIQTPTNSQ